MARGQGPWTPAQATQHINSCAKRDDLQLSWTHHATERMRERGLVMSDLLYLLKTGFVHDEAEASTREGFFKYRVEGTTPNSNRRAVRVVVIPDPKSSGMKLVTIMWRDER
ncbi:MAG: DUF4258 domain-containing protein [Brevundimonas sp.]|nr:MAG: DUF4258 domain-containing protein [Brevundimonas sp.]